MANDVAAITLRGPGATFMHVKRSANLGGMPEGDQILHQWERVPGDAVFIRNHPDARDDMYRLPPHAVENGDEQRVSLQVQVSYDYPH